MSMDRIILIEEVCKRKGLWKRSHAEYGTPCVREQLWEEVAAITGFSIDDARKKWKHLKDNFRKEYKKVRKSCSTDGVPKYVSPWPFYDHMTFVKDELLSVRQLSFSSEFKPPKQRISKSFSPSSRPKQSPSKVEEATFCVAEQPKQLQKKPVTFALITSAPTSTSSFQPVVVRVNGVKRQASGDDDDDTKEPSSVTTSVGIQTDVELLPQRQETTDQQFDFRESDDYHFFVSLIPHVRNFGTIQKLRLRNKIQQLILDEACDAATS